MILKFSYSCEPYLGFFLRALGFAFMVLVLWSPVAVPLLPTLVQSWTTKNPSRIAELACIVGLYTAVTILVMQWGKRIRGYENPPEQYGLDLTSLPNVWFGKYSFFFNGLENTLLFYMLEHLYLSAIL